MIAHENQVFSGYALIQEFLKIWHTTLFKHVFCETRIHPINTHNKHFICNSSIHI